MLVWAEYLRLQDEWLLLPFGEKNRHNGHCCNRRCRSADPKVVEMRWAVIIFQQDMRTGPVCISASGGKHQTMPTGFVGQ
jgi:hypothetical protein